jgi:hypothetical protein
VSEPPLGKENIPLISLNRPQAGFKTDIFFCGSNLMLMRTIGITTGSMKKTAHFTFAKSGGYPSLNSFRFNF